MVYQKVYHCFMVGVTGFEPAASWSRTKRTTKLCHTPKYYALLHRNIIAQPLIIVNIFLKFSEKNGWVDRGKIVLLL